MKNKLNYTIFTLITFLVLCQLVITYIVYSYNYTEFYSELNTTNVLLLIAHFILPIIMSLFYIRLRKIIFEGSSNIIKITIIRNIVVINSLTLFNVIGFWIMNAGNPNRAFKRNFLDVFSIGAIDNVLGGSAMAIVYSLDLISLLLGILMVIKLLKMLYSKSTLTINTMLFNCTYYFLVLSLVTSKLYYLFLINMYYSNSA